MGFMWMRFIRKCSWQNPGAGWGSRRGMEGREARVRYPGKSHRWWGQHDSVLQDSSGDLWGTPQNRSNEEAVGLEYLHVFIPLVRLRLGRWQDCLLTCLCGYRKDVLAVCGQPANEELQVLVLGLRRRWSWSPTSGCSTCAPAMILDVIRMS